MRGEWQLSDDQISRILRIRCFAAPFLAHALDSIPWRDYEVVGFSSTFEQNIASLALARQVKRCRPHIVTIFGGANWEDEMGIALHASFPFVDYACSGEAEESLLALLERLRTGRDPTGVPGVIHRHGPASVMVGPAEPIRNLDALPIPDFSDYFATLHRARGLNAVSPVLLCETSRGCWWGERSHCTFCGLNGGAMGYRSKTPARVLTEFCYLSDRWRIGFIEVVDNILDMSYFDTVLAELGRRRLPLNLFYETKSNLRRWQVRRLAEAGVVRIQPGIESLDDRILKLMGKGVTALRNVQLLKWCKQFCIAVDWNFLYGFPGETPEDYARMQRVLSAIRHLDPPAGCGPVRLDRFSPYFETPHVYGICNVRPLAAYRHVYPFDRETLARLAYSFDFDLADGGFRGETAEATVQYVAEWIQNPEQGALWQVEGGGDAIELIDTRGGSERQVRLAGLDRALYEFCDEVRPLATIGRFLRGLRPDLTISDEEIASSLDALVDNELMLSFGNAYLSLAVRAVETAGLQPAHWAEMA